MRRFIWLASFVACCVMIAIGLSQAQVAQTGAGKATPGGAAGYTGPGDVTGYTTGVVAWWGLRPFTNAIALAGGKIANICDNATGNTCLNATANTNGTINIPNVGGGSNPCDNSTNKCEIATLYDQSGASSCSGACDTTATHASGNRPLLVVNCLGSLPCISPAGTQMISIGVIASTTAQPFVASGVGLRSSSALTQSSLVSGGANASQILWAASSGTIGLYDGSSFPTATGAADNTVHTFQALFNNTTSAIFIDATNNALNIATTNGLTSAQQFRFPSNENGGLTGELFEAGYWAGDKSSSFSAMHSNQCTYWGTTC